MPLDYIKESFFLLFSRNFLHFFSSFLNVISSFVHKNYNHHHLHILLYIALIAIVLIIRLYFMLYSTFRNSVAGSCLLVYELESISLLLMIPFFICVYFSRSFAFNLAFKKTMIFYLYIIYWSYFSFCSVNVVGRRNIYSVYAGAIRFQWLPHEWHLKNLRFALKVCLLRLLAVSVVVSLQFKSNISLNWFEFMSHSSFVFDLFCLLRCVFSTSSSSVQLSQFVSLFVRNIILIVIRSLLDYAKWLQT